MAKAAAERALRWASATSIASAVLALARSHIAGPVTLGAGLFVTARDVCKAADTLVDARLSALGIVDRLLRRGYCGGSPR